MDLFSVLAATGISLPSNGNVTYVAKGSILIDAVHQPIPFAVLIILMMTSLCILSLQPYSV